MNDNFKNWMDEDAEPPKLNRKKNYLIGLEVYPKIRTKKLIQKMIPQEGTLCDLVEEFKNKGGEISQVEGKNFIIEVYSGSFSIHRMYVTKR
jgi:hypothetical protein